QVYFLFNSRRPRQSTLFPYTTLFRSIYVNVDDCWQAGRDEQGRIVPNRNFGDMKALADYVHSKGLKFGIYSSPGPETCAGRNRRSEEHTSELQSLAYLVCRLLLEKKK